MRKVKEFSLEFVNSNFYECDGKVFRKDGRNCSNWIDKKGYYNICFKKKDYKVHRILWVLYNKESIPEDYFVDHIDNCSTNNSKENLRLASFGENNHNCKIRKDNTTGVKGVTTKISGKYRYYYCQIGNNGNRTRTQFPYTPSGLESAKQWLEEQRQDLHGEFSRSE